MTYLLRVFRPALPLWALYFVLVVVAGQFYDVPWDVKTLLIVSGFVLNAAVRRLAW